MYKDNRFSFVIPLYQYYRKIFDSEHRAQIFKKVGVNSIAFFFELQCLKGTLGNLLKICRGDFLIS